MYEPLASLLERVALSFAPGVRCLHRYLGKEIAEGRSGSCTQWLSYQPVTTSFSQTLR